jgi:uncharacterized protein (AIM24 family)
LKLEDRSSFFARLFGAPGITLSTATNVSNTPVLLGLNQTECGKFLVLKLRDQSVYCFKDSFVCATEEVSVQPKTLPIQMSLLVLGAPQLFNRAHFCHGRGGSIFLQAGSAIFERTLQRGDTITIKMSCMVAFESTCTLSVVSATRSLVVNYHGAFLKLQGPGKVYFCAHGSQQKSSSAALRPTSRGLVHSNITTFGVVIHFLTIILSLYTMTLIMARLDAENENEIPRIIRF